MTTTKHSPIETSMVYGGISLTIVAEPCSEQHVFPNETPHLVVKVSRDYDDFTFIDTMLDSKQARTLGLALLNGAEKLDY